MATTADVITVGAGIMGASTAYHLARRGAGRVVVLERDTVGHRRWPAAASATSTPTASASS